MPHNPNQPREHDGRFSTMPAQAPQAAPTRPAPLAGDTDAAGLTLGDFLAQFGLRVAGNSTDDITHLPIEFAPPGARQAPVEHTPEGLHAQNVADVARRNDQASDADWARSYHTRFRNFNARTLDATKELFRARPSQLDPATRSQVFETWVNTISDIYDMERPTFHWNADADFGGGGYYRPADHSITMSPNHPSVITLIHETRHALQHHGKGAPMISRDVERDARAWSLSLYYKVRPNLLKRLVREGRVFHIDPTVFDTPPSAPATE